MAWGLECMRCGHQETTHKHFQHEYPDCCNNYQSPDSQMEQRLWEADRMNNLDYEMRRAKASGLVES